MIDPKELRIGNLFYTISKSTEIHFPLEIAFKITGVEEFKVSAIHCDQNVLSSPGYLHIDIRDMSPIPLTPEILEKAGFVKNDDAGNWNSPNRTIYSHKLISLGVTGEYIGWYNSSEDDFYSSFYPQVKTVHQLQNLVFALTGQELEISLS